MLNLKRIRTIMFVVFLTSASNALAYDGFTIVDLTGENINKQLKAVLGDKMKDGAIAFPYDIVTGRIQFEMYDKRFMDKVKDIFDQKVTETCKQSGECLIPYPVTYSNGSVRGIYLKEADKAEIESVVIKATELGMLVPFGIDGKYYCAAMEYSINNCSITVILNYTALPLSGSALSFQVFAPRNGKDCSSAVEVKKEAEMLADYLEKRLK